MVNRNSNPRVLCMCGMDLGYRVAEFLLESGVNPVFVVNEGETAGDWYRTPGELNIEEIKESEIPGWKPDLILTAWYHKILTEELFHLPALGAWNIHLGDAERYRGAYPSIRALMNGDTSYGVTLHRIDSGIDTGDILAKLSFPIPEGSTGKELYHLMVEKGFDLFKSTWSELLSGAAMRLTAPQKNENAETMYRKDLSHRLYPDRDLIRKVLALTFPPFPPPWFTAGGKKFKIVEDPDEDDI